MADDQTHDFLSSFNKGLVVDGNKRRITKKESFQNLLLVAKVGIGKTTEYIIPNIFDLAHRNCSIAVNDSKGELFEKTSGYLKSRGFKVIKFNLNDVTDSHWFNPYASVTSEIELENISETLIMCGNPMEKEPYWNNGAIRILNVLAKCLSFGDPKEFTLPKLYELVQRLGVKGVGIKEWIKTHGFNPAYPDDPYIINEWAAVTASNEKQFAIFADICLVALKALSNREVSQFFSQTDYNLADFRREKTIIYFITPAKYQKLFSFAISLFFRSLFNECMREEHLENKRSLPAYILYDEFGNSYISDFQSIANTARGYGISLSLVLQSISQLELRYGSAEADAIQGAVNTYMCMNSSDMKTTEYFSNLIGKVRETQYRAIKEPNTDYREYNLINANEIRTMEDHEVLLVSRNRQPVKFKATPYYKHRKYKIAAQFPQASMPVRPNLKRSSV